MFPKRVIVIKVKHLFLSRALCWLCLKKVYNNFQTYQSMCRETLWLFLKQRNTFFLQLIESSIAVLDVYHLLGFSP